jgi:hypothetical protein
MSISISYKLLKAHSFSILNIKMKKTKKNMQQLFLLKEKLEDSSTIKMKYRLRKLNLLEILRAISS